MQLDLERFASLLLAMLAIVALFNLACKHVLFTRLRRDHPRVWQELGEPSLFRARSWREAMDRPKVVWISKMTRLPEPENVRVVYFARVSDVVGVILFIAAMAVFTLLY